MTQTNIQNISSPTESGTDDNDLPFRMAPHNIEAEQALLGAILVNNEAHDRVSSFLEVDHFFEPLHGRIFQVATRLILNNKPATPITLKTFFDHEEPVDENLTVPQYLGRLAAGATTIINAKEYGQTIYDLAQRRTLIIIGEDMVNTAYESTVEEPPALQIEEAEQKLYKLAETGKYGQGFESFASALRGCIEMADAAYRRGGGLSGVSTGLTDLDRQMGGLQGSDLIVLAGRPSMGKTALATNIAFNIAKAHNLAAQQGKTTDGIPAPEDGAVVGFYSLEMSSEQLATRIVSEQSLVPSEKIRRGMISDDDFRELVRVSQELQEIPFFIDPTGGISIAQLAARARRLKRQHNLGVIIVDYLQLLTGSSKNSQANRVQEITEITTGLKALAKELSVPIVALSQLSRQVEQREDKRPQLSDLRESGSIEQDADVVLFVYREEYYVSRSEPREGTPEHLTWQDEMDRTMGMAEVIVAKQRHGPVGTVKMQFTGEFTRFSDYIDNEHIPDRRDY
jgi:replicative DNA helicase